MSGKSHLIEVKKALAEKYARLATLTSSKTKKHQFSSRATRYRRQVAQMQHAAQS